jgi:hypothetical protein
VNIGKLYMLSELDGNQKIALNWHKHQGVSVYHAIVLTVALKDWFNFLQLNIRLWKQFCTNRVSSNYFKELV